MTQKATVKRLKYLGSMLSKYAHVWGENPSQRMFDWVDEYDSHRGTPAWIAYCVELGFTVDHDAYDCMA